MIFYIVGYKQCPFYLDACKAFEKAGLSFTPVVVTSKEALQSAVTDLCTTVRQLGVVGETSPQILRWTKDSVVYLGGYNELELIGMDHISKWLPALNF